MNLRAAWVRKPHDYLDLHLFTWCLARCGLGSRMYRRLLGGIEDFKISEWRVERLGFSRGKLSLGGSESFVVAFA